MKLIFVVSAIFSALLVSQTAITEVSPTPVVIKNSPGGLLKKYDRAFANLKKSGSPVVIIGSCMSACTRYMKLPNICAMPDSLFGFHGVRDADTDKMLPELSQKDSSENNFPEAFEFEKKYKTWEYGFVQTIPYVQHTVEPDVSIFYSTYDDPKTGTVRHQKFLIINADHFIKPCPGTNK